MGKRTTIMIETSSLLILSSRSTVRSWCPKCAAEEQMIVLENTGECVLVLLCYKMLSRLKIPAAAGYRKGEWVLFKRRSRHSRTFIDWFGRLW
jgi:hypothetical protein